MGVIVDSCCGKDTADLCRENSRKMFDGAFDVKSAVGAMDRIDRNNDLGLPFELLLSLFVFVIVLFHNPLLPVHAS
jgi:hypothetical protein